MHIIKGAKEPPCHPYCPRGLERWQPSMPISLLALYASFGLRLIFYHPRDPFWAGLGKPEASCLSRKTRRFYKTRDNPKRPGGPVLTAGLSSDTPRRHRTSPLSLTAHSATLCPLLSACALSGMMDTSLRVMGATSSHGPLVTSLHFLCRETGAWVQGPGVTGSLGTAHRRLLLTWLSSACRS